MTSAFWARSGTQHARRANWQSEFLQLVWQAAGLTLLLFWGSSQSKKSDERIEVKIDLLLEEQGIDPSTLSAEVNRAI